jgi:hypothetical protein
MRHDVTRKGKPSKTVVGNHFYRSKIVRSAGLYLARKQRLAACTALTDLTFYVRWTVFTERYELDVKYKSDAFLFAICFLVTAGMQD